MMNAISDGLDSQELIHDIVEELVYEFPALDADSLESLVTECRARLPRPATGGVLFLEAQKFSRLLDDCRDVHGDWSGTSTRH